MNILYYNWNENSATDIIKTLISMGHKIKNKHIDFSDYNKDSLFCSILENELVKNILLPIYIICH